MLIFTVLIGLALLLIGRQLFWLAVAGLGFVLSLTYASQFIQASAQTILLISLGIGVIGAILSYSLQRAAASILGFLAGWFLTISLINYLDLSIDFTTLLAVIGGLVGIGLISIAYDWSLIILSALSGTALITQSIYYSQQVKIGIFIVLLIFGVTIQGFMLIQEGGEQH